MSTTVKTLRGVDDGQNATQCRRRSKRDRRDLSSLLKSVVLILLILLVPTLALGVGAHLARGELAREKLDDTFCYARADQYQSAIFVDFSLTHQTSASQRRDLENTVTDAYAALPPNGKLSIFTTENRSTSTVTQPLFVICKPAQTPQEQAALGAPESAAPRLARIHGEAETTFRTHLAEMMAKSTTRANLAVSSPILEQIQGISRYRFDTPLSRLLIYTDGLNNSAAGEFCAVQGHLPRYAAFAARPEFRFVRPEDLGGADVDILLVEGSPLPTARLPYCTTEEVRTFWVEFFEGNGAGRVTLTPLGYGAGQ